jgi:ethanolamine ammonia-lyase large subunit
MQCTCVTVPDKNMPSTDNLFAAVSKVCTSATGILVARKILVIAHES